ncbi:MAG TPA: hypothetical protein DD440_01460 [Porticoccaceae bacterium]|nr:hypothetical protein [Porticoccaceae bacterium]
MKIEDKTQSVAVCLRTVGWQGLLGKCVLLEKPAGSGYSALVISMITQISLRCGYRFGVGLMNAKDT